MNEPNLIRWLTHLAAKERDLFRLSLAFKAHRPEWGSQASLVALGLSGFLSYIDWDVSTTEERFPEWYEMAQTVYDEQLLFLRTTQVKELTEMVQHPRNLVLRPAPTMGEHAGDRALFALAQRGLLFDDVVRLARLDLDLPYIGGHLSFEQDPAFAELLRQEQPELARADVRRYLDVVHRQDQDVHPNVLMHSVLQHWETLGKLSSPFVSVPTSPLLPTGLLQGQAPRAARDALGLLSGKALKA